MSKKSSLITFGILRLWRRVYVHVLIGAMLIVPAIEIANAQETDIVKLSSWVALNAPTGHEHLATGPLSQSLQGWSVDRSGNLLKTTGAGEPRRVVACGLDWNA